MNGMNHFFYRILIRLAILTLLSFLGVAGFYWALGHHVRGYLAAHPFRVVDPGPWAAKSRPADPANGRLGRDAMDEIPLEHTKNEPIALSGPHPIETDLLLLGTVSGNPSTSFAIIKSRSTGVQGLYKPGQTIWGGVLSEILREKVVIVLGDRQFVLRVQDDDREGTANSQNAIGLSAGDIQEALDDTAKTLAQIDFQPYSQDGEKGLRLTRVAPGSIFDRIGLRAGDVIRQVNNVPIENPQAFSSLFNQMKSFPVGISLDTLDDDAVSIITQFSPAAGQIGVEVANLVEKMKSGKGVDMELNRGGRTLQQTFMME